MSSDFPRPTISAANGCAIIAAFPLKRLHHCMRPVDADLVYTSTGQVALTILLENGDRPSDSAITPMAMVKYNIRLSASVCGQPTSADVCCSSYLGSSWFALYGCSVARKVAAYLGDVLEDQKDKLHENLLANGSQSSSYLVKSLSVVICLNSSVICLALG